ncbi:MAG TPA: hypothetical protein VIF02_10125 [Methylocella sp.]
MLGFKYVLLVGEQYSHGSNWLHPRFTLHAGSTTEARLRSEGYLKPAADPQALH